MDTPDHARSEPTRRLRVPDSNLLGRELAKSGFGFYIVYNGYRQSAHTKTQAFTRLAEAISQGDRALADQILSRWGVRR